MPNFPKNQIFQIFQIFLSPDTHFWDLLFCLITDNLTNEFGSFYRYYSEVQNENKINKEAFLVPIRTSTIELFCKNS